MGNRPIYALRNEKEDWCGIYSCNLSKYPLRGVKFLFGKTIMISMLIKEGKILWLTVVCSDIINRKVSWTASETVKI
jgi:hypothetical protein